MSDELTERVARANLAAFDSAGAAAYIDGAPHLKHASLRRLYAKLLVEVFERARRHTLSPRVLDLGAGEGSVTLPLLDLGAHVTAVDISPDQVAALRRKCAAYGDRLTARCEDIAETLRTDGDCYDIIVANSFLHHVPDYLGLLRDLLPRLSANGQFFSFQDPLRYSTQRRFDRLFDQAAYAFWRLGRRDVWRGLQRRWRRARGVYSADSSHDNAEYHVLRDGLDQEAIVLLFGGARFSCRIETYFSTQNVFFQSLGAALGIKNTFAIVASRQR